MDQGTCLRTDSQIKSIVRQYIDSHLDKSDPPVEYTIYVVWFCYILGGWKALVSSTLSDDMYYEVTYNKDKYETYLDAYKKLENAVYTEAL